MINDSSVNINTETQKALQYHQSGDLEKAEAIYEALLQINPNCSELLHLFGVLANQRNDNSKAFRFINRAIKINPTNPYYYCSLAAVLIDKGQLSEAVAC